MITEDYVSFETAKLLKEKGFDGLCYKVWESHGDSTTLVGGATLVGAAWFVEGETVVNRELVDTAAKRYADEYNLNYTVDGYLAPTLQMAMKWLREVHNFNVNTELNIHGYFCSLSHIERDSSGYIIDIEDSEAWETAYYDSYEQACEAAIKYCLENLI